MAAENLLFTSTLWLGETVNEIYIKIHAELFQVWSLRCFFFLRQTFKLLNRDLFTKLYGAQNLCIIKLFVTVHALFQNIVFVKATKV